MPLQIVSAFRRGFAIGNRLAIGRDVCGIILRIPANHNHLAESELLGESLESGYRDSFSHHLVPADCPKPLYSFLIGSPEKYRSFRFFLSGGHRVLI